MITRIKVIAGMIVMLAGYVLFNSCHGIKDSLKGRCIYAGKSYLIDTLGGKGAATDADSSIKVYLYVKGSTNYLYQVTTKDKGNFSMDFLEKDKEYTITADYKLNNVKYSGNYSFKADKCDRDYSLSIVNDTIKMTMYAEIGKRNLVTFMVNDGQNVVPKAEGCLFTSEELFKTRNCLNANYSSTGSETGKLTFSNIPEGHYFLYVNKKLDTTATAPVLSGRSDIQVAAGKIYEQPITIN